MNPALQCVTSLYVDDLDGGYDSNNVIHAAIFMETDQQNEQR